MSEQQKCQASQALSWKEKIVIPDQGFFTAELLEKANWMMLKNQKEMSPEISPIKKKK